jgi:hypothetical protein
MILKISIYYLFILLTNNTTDYREYTVTCTHRALGGYYSATMLGPRVGAETRHLLVLVAPGMAGNTVKYL